LLATLRGGRHALHIVVSTRLIVRFIRNHQPF
jgi:hypothetical protein